MRRSMRFAETDGIDPDQERTAGTKVAAEQDGSFTRPRRRRGIDGWDGGPDRLRILRRSRRDAGPKIALCI